MNKLPPNVLRELRRHVSPQPISRKSPDVIIKELHQERQQRMKYVLAASVLFTATMASIPFVAHYYMSGLNEKEEPLTSAQVRRGAFLNSGTKDIGKDPNWDFQTGKYKYDSGYNAIYQQEQQRNQSMLGGEYYAIPSNQLAEQEEKLRAFAEGRRKQNGETTNYEQRRT